MKCLLVAVNAKYIHSNPAVYSLAAYAKGRDKSLADVIEIAEYTINHRLDAILADIYAKKPDILAFSCYIWNISYIRQLFRELHKLLPKTDIWLGGPEVSFDAEKYLEDYPFLKGILLGEGEKTFYELMSRYYSKWRMQDISSEKPDDGGGENEKDRMITVDFDDIAGLALAKSGDKPIRFTEPREPMELNEFPFLYGDFTPFENRILYYESSRGCPFRCSYCLSSIDKRLRLKSAELVCKELQLLLDAKVSQVKFVDRTFNCVKEHAVAIWRFLLENDNGVTNFHFEIAADLLDEEELSILSRFRPGAVQLEIGVQSVNAETLRAINRKTDLAALKKAVTKIRENGNIHIHLDLIAGLPHEDYASFGKSFDEVYAMRPHQLQLGFLKLLKGSPMQEAGAGYGLVCQEEAPYEVLYTDWLSFSDICRLKRIEEMVELYYNSGQFSTTLRLLAARTVSPFTLFEALADYYAARGLFTNSPARGYRYQVLFDFLCEQFPEARELFAEALTMDLYLRENAKQRPVFARELSDYKEEIRMVCQSEAKEHRNLPEEVYGDMDARAIARAVHIEPFLYDLETGRKREKIRYGLFDYRSRDAVTHNARLIWIK